MLEKLIQGTTKTQTTNMIQLTSLLCMIHRSFLKVKLEMTSSKRSIDNSEKLVDWNGQYLFAEKENNLFLSPVLD